MLISPAKYEAGKEPRILHIKIYRSNAGSLGPAPEWGICQKWHQMMYVCDFFVRLVSQKQIPEKYKKEKSTEVIKCVLKIDDHSQQ